MKKPVKDMSLMHDESDNIVMFYPHVSKLAKKSVMEVLDTRWIGQGPKVKIFEESFSNKFASKLPAIAVGSGTDALHLSYILAGLKPGDEVIAPVFTCTATNIPFLYMGVKILFADIDPNTMNIDINHVAQLMNKNVKAIICVHYGGLPCDMDELQNIADKWSIPIIEDAAHAVGAKYKGSNIGSISDFTMFSFQAIKHITTGDGGMLIVKNKELIDQAERVRWFGIDRNAKQAGIWENDITEIGYKYQMTDIAAAMGIASLQEFDAVSSLRKRLFKVYSDELAGYERVKIIGNDFDDREHAAWLFTIIVDNRYKLQEKLRDNKIESNQVHFRNDRYSIFKDFTDGKNFPNMDQIEDKYLVLPLHTMMNENDVRRVCSIIKSGW
ncbi:DegT/DnrJ/EryC1/StrS family aminotransferase [Candidatus Pseudothioglobus singularis]|nr:DegT/DnrJ/EryC1/StrS family aminotransferase [Candidatus Pseudothioglobus singularis]MDB4822247.1 DegT/DnrJ/EryC1/StrS family aminotransferase [Candidatus Pseudothioglobus singularis]